MKKIGTLFYVALLLFGFSSTIYAENQQEYRLNKALCKKYVKLSRAEVEKGNITLARAYAKKAIQANAWSKFAWANYNDIIQRLADEGQIEDFGAVVEESKASENAPSAEEGEEQFEGC